MEYGPYGKVMNANKEKKQQVVVSSRVVQACLGLQAFSFKFENSHFVQSIKV